MGEEVEEENCPESLEGDESGNCNDNDIESPEEGLVNVSEGREGEGLDQRGDFSTEDAENELPDAESELATTICAECAPVVQRMLENIERRVLQQLQESIVKSSQ